MSNIEKLRQDTQHIFTIISKKIPSQDTNIIIEFSCSHRVKIVAKNARRYKSCPKCSKAKRLNDGIPGLRIRTVAHKGALKIYGGRCLITGRKRSLTTHHITPISVDPTLALAPDNLALITKALHKKFHSLFGPKPTRAQFFMFFIQEILETKPKATYKKKL